jgi:hypothetical protein
VTAVIARHPNPDDGRWCSFERRGGTWEPFSAEEAEAGSLESLIRSSLSGLSGISQRTATEVREVLAYEPADLLLPALRNVSMTVMCPVRATDDVWCQLYVARNEIVYAGRTSHFRNPPNLGNEILAFFARLGWPNLEKNERPIFPRELLVRPIGWLASAILPTEFESAEEARRRAQREATDAAYQERLKLKDPAVRRQRQFEIDTAALKGAAGERERKRVYGFGASVKLGDDK